MSDLRSPGSQAGATRGKSESQKNHDPLSGSNAGSPNTTGTYRMDPTTPPTTKGRKGNPVR